MNIFLQSDRHFYFDKQVLSALAIGIGAGILLNPVTARADEADRSDYQAENAKSARIFVKNKHCFIG